jgi:lipid II:glycine glycyltransferase (peptidoglycan interpeptide bridge formation enzyme)
LIVEQFLQSIPSKFKYWDIYLNAGNFFEIQFFPLYQRMNYVLPLLENYEVLYKKFRDNIKRNVKKAIQLNCFVQKDFPVDEVIALAKAQSNKFSSITQNDYANFTLLYNLLHVKKQAITYGVYSARKELLASAVFFFFHKRAYYILAGNHPDGKAFGASHALLNAFIQGYAGQDLILDFEGSDIQSLAFFYSSFGAKEEKYPGLRLNKLPKLLQYFKK